MVIDKRYSLLAAHILSFGHDQVNIQTILLLLSNWLDCIAMPRDNALRIDSGRLDSFDDLVPWSERDAGNLLWLEAHTKR